MPSHPPEIEVMLKACYQASDTIARDLLELEKLQISQKSLGNFVSSTDIKIENTIKRILQKARPNYEILLEEGGLISAPSDEQNNPKQQDSIQSQFRWIIDPIDGTTNFLHSYPSFAISIALQEKGVLPKLGLKGTEEKDPYELYNVTAGVIHIPCTNETFWAVKNKGAYLIDANGNETKTLDKS